MTGTSYDGAFPQMLLTVSAEHSFNPCCRPFLILCHEDSRCPRNLMQERDSYVALPGVVDLDLDLAWHEHDSFRR